MTYNVFDGTLSLTQSLRPLNTAMFMLHTLTTPELCIAMQLSGSRESWWSALAVER